MYKIVILVLCLIQVLIISIEAQSCPKIVTRAEWNARPGGGSKLKFRPAPYVHIHHTAGAACDTDAKCSQQMRNIQKLHLDTRKWSDIGYNFCVGGNGMIYIGRGWDRQGAHAPGYNNQSIGICFIGTFTSQTPTQAAIKAAQDLIACGVAQGHIRPTYGLVGHRQTSATACPGDSLFNLVRTWPKWKSNPKPLR